MKILYTLLLLVGSVSVFAQNNELDERNGFKNIKLLSKATDYLELKFDKPQAEQYKAIYVRKVGYMESIGEIQIKDLKVYTYKDLIYQIDVVTNKEPELFKGLEAAFGKAKFSVVGNEYFWQGNKVKLTFSSMKGGKKVIMSYSTPEIKDIIKQDEQAEIKQLSEDF
ncbi:MAG: hypothetical protein KDC79_17595 [Cyclobacteriaceae bacterium]|nr:hypothetical protein [Cyclobacteriaceae bacterium]